MSDIKILEHIRDNIDIFQGTLFQYNITETKLKRFIRERKNARTATATATAARNNNRATVKKTRRPSGAVALTNDGRTLTVIGDVWIKHNNHWVPLTERKMEVLCTDGYLYAPYVVLGSNTCVNNNDATKEQMNHVKTFLDGDALKAVEKRLTERFLNAKKISGLPRKLQMNIERDTVFLSRCQQIQNKSNLSAGDFLLLDPFYNRDIEKEKEKTKDAKAGKVTLRLYASREEKEEEEEEEPSAPTPPEAVETKSSDEEGDETKTEEPPSAPKPPSASETPSLRTVKRREGTRSDGDQVDDEEEDDEEEIDFDEAAASYASESADDLSVDEETLNDMDVKALMEDKHVLDMLNTLSDSESVREMSASESDHDLRDIPVSVESDKEFSFAASSSEDDNTLASIMQHLDASGSEDEEEELQWASTSSGAD